MKVFKKLSSKVSDGLHEIWYGGKKSHWRFLLAIGSYFYFSGFHWFRSKVRKYAYQSKVPVFVVGNISVGGNGKTPAILALIALLQKRNFKVGVVSRGYPINPKKTIVINNTTTTADVSDEPLLIYQKTGVPVCVCVDRQGAIMTLEKLGVDVILSDDGLQNFSFEHTIEMIMVDGARLFGNGKILPAGPLREPLSRLKSSRFVVEKLVNHQPPSSLGFRYQLRLMGERFYPVSAGLMMDSNKVVDATFFQGKKVLAITTIAQPQSFFGNLTQLGIVFESVSKPDHAPLCAEDFTAYADYEILMTEKDAVKCENFANARFWRMPLTGRFSENLEEAFWEYFLQLPKK